MKVLEQLWDHRESQMAEGKILTSAVILMDYKSCDQLKLEVMGSPHIHIRVPFSEDEPIEGFRICIRNTMYTVYRTPDVIGLKLLELKFESRYGTETSDRNSGPSQ